MLTLSMAWQSGYRTWSTSFEGGAWTGGVGRGSTDRVEVSAALVIFGGSPLVPIPCVWLTTWRQVLNESLEGARMC